MQTYQIMPQYTWVQMMQIQYVQKSMLKKKKHIKLADFTFLSQIVGNTACKCTDTYLDCLTYSTFINTTEHAAVSWGSIEKLLIKQKYVEYGDTAVICRKQTAAVYVYFLALVHILVDVQDIYWAGHIRV